MELDKRKFFEKYGFDESNDQERFRTRLSSLMANDKVTLIRLFKNLLAIRVLHISEREQGIQKWPDQSKIKIWKVFKEVHFNTTLGYITKEMSLIPPRVTITTASCLITIISIVVWVVFVIVFLTRHIEIFLSGTEWVLVLIPFSLVLIGAPYLLMRSIFPNFFSSRIQGVETFEDFIDSLYSLNAYRYFEDDFNHSVKDLLILSKEIDW